MVIVASRDYSRGSSQKGDRHHLVDQICRYRPNLDVEPGPLSTRVVNIRARSAPYIDVFTASERRATSAGAHSVPLGGSDRIAPSNFRSTSA